MRFGEVEDFAIECFREPEFPNDRGWVFGRVCLWGRGVRLGDLSEPACMLNITESAFRRCLNQLDELHDESLDNLPDEAAFLLLDAALYLDDDRTNEQVYADANRYSRFKFLIDWGESFDGTKAFLLKSGGHFRILYRLSRDSMGSVEVTHDGLVNAILAFLEWMAIEKRAVPTA